MRRFVLLVTVTAFVVATTMVLAGTAFAASENDSCFADYVQLTTSVPDVGPGSFVNEAARNLPPEKEHVAQSAQKLRQAVEGC
jgi:hypothetical protein